METRTIKIPQLLGIPLSEIARELSCTNETLIINIKRHPSERLYLKAFKISQREYRVYWEDVVDFIERNYVGAKIQLNT
jgi:hypothetical protein